MKHKIIYLMPWIHENYSRGIKNIHTRIFEPHLISSPLSFTHLDYKNFLWVYATAFNKAPSTRWYFKVKFKRYTKLYSSRYCIEGYTYSKEKSLTIMTNFLVKNNFKFLTKKQIKKFKVMQ